MDKSDLRIEQLQQYLDKKKGVVESDIKEYNQQLGKNYLHFFDWHADDLYKACYMDKNYKAIQEAIDTAETPKDIEGYLKRCTPVCRRRSPERSACQEKYQPDVEYGPFPGDGMQTGVTEGPPVFKQASSE